jgi:hypothetical protein
MLLTMPSQTTIETAAMFAMIAHKTGYMHHTGSICSEQHKEDFRLKFTLKSAIPDLQAFLLQQDQVLQTQEEERIYVIWVVWARNKATNEHEALLVVQRWREIE